MSRISTRLWIPVIGSFAVYLVPLVGPHAIWLVGESLAQGVADADGPNPWWLAANVAFAFAAQIATGLLLAWTTRGSRLRLLTWVPMLPALVAGMNVAYPGGRVDFSLGFQFAAPGGAAILERVALATSARSWWLLPAPSAPMIPIERLELAQGSPILSEGGDALAWIERVGDAPPYPERVAIRELKASDGLTPHLIDLERFGRASYTPLGVDTVAREVMLWRNDGPVRVGFEGDRRPLGFTPGAIRAQPSTYLRTHDGWVAWNAYRDEGPYQLAWSLAGRSGMHRTNNGRSITSAAVDPTGSFIAISETTTLSIGDARDVVYVIRASDGVDVFRRYLARYARSQVVFFEGGFFAYSDLAGTYVLKLP